MNRRQRKKQFKMIYGMSPDQYERWLNDHWKDIMISAIATTYEVIKLGFAQLGREVAEAVQIIRNGIDEMTEEIRAAAEICNLEGEEKDDSKDGVDS